MNINKFKLNKNESIEWNGYVLYRIIYADGTKGGWLESEYNLSQEGNCCVLNEAKVYDGARIMDNCVVFDNSEVSNYVRLEGEIEIKGNVKINSIKDFIVFKNHWSSGRYFVYTKKNKMWKVGCFYGTGEQLIEKAYSDSELSGKYYESYVKFVEQLEKLDAI